MPKFMCDLEPNEYVYIAGHSRADGSPVATKVRFLRVNDCGRPVVRISRTNIHLELTGIDGMFKAEADALQYATDHK